MAIRHPLKTRLVCTKYTIGFTSAAIWLLSGIFGVPYGWHKTVVFNSDCPVVECVAERTTEIYTGVNQNPFKSAEFATFYLAPLISISVIYFLIVRELWSDDMCRSTRTDEGVKTKKLVIKMLIVCVAVFFISYSPVQIFFLASYFGQEFNPNLKTILLLNALA